jgi:hypothetical protein
MRDINLMMPPTYAYLTVSARRCDVVLLPDGTRKVVDEGSGHRIAESWHPDHSASSVADPDPGYAQRTAQAAADVAARLQAFEGELSRWEARLRSRISSNKLRLDPADDATVRKQYEREYPRPEPPDAAVMLTPKVQVAVWWHAECQEAQLAVPLAEATVAFPRNALANTLTLLAKSGWRVVHVSEERAVEHGADASRAVVIGAAVLLQCGAP